MGKPTAIWAALCAAFLALQAPAARAEGTLDILAKFTGMETELDVQTYEQDSKKAALIEMLTPSERASFVFDAQNADRFLELWNKAKAMQAGSWSLVGSLAESRAANASTISISAGIGVRFILNDPKLGSFTHVLAPENMPAFEDALKKARSFLGS